MSRRTPAKITAADKQEMLAMRKQGMTYAEIARHFPVTETRVKQILSHFTGKAERRRAENYIFPNITEWLNATGMSLVRIAEHTGYSVTSISNYFRGLHAAPLTFIKSFLPLTGMTFEAAFATPDEIKNAAPSGEE